MRIASRPRRSPRRCWPVSPPGRRWPIWNARSCWPRGRASNSTRPTRSSPRGRCCAVSTPRRWDGGSASTRPALPIPWPSSSTCGAAVELELLAPEMLDFDLERLGAALAPERDLAFQYLGLQTLYDRYLIHHQRAAHRAAADALDAGRHGSRAARTRTREERAIAFYDLISSFRFCPSTPTLFNAGTRYPQLSSCYLSTVGDDLGRDLQDGPRQRPPLQVERRHRQRLDPGARPRQPHQGHQRRQPGRRPLPQGRQRHRHRGQSGRQAQGRRLRLPRGLAPRRRGVPRPAQEHRRRPPPHPRHAHRLVDPRSLHAAGARPMAIGPSSARATSPTCTISTALPSPGATPSTKPRSTGARSPTPHGCARSTSGGRC